VLVGEDSTVGREACIRLRAVGKTPADAGRRELSRASRLRWLTCGREGDRHWDAFVAPMGTPLTELVAAGKRLGWRELRPIMQNLADELAAACADGTLPASLTLEQVWVQPNGQIQLLDFPLTAARPPPPRPPPPPGAGGGGGGGGGGRGRPPGRRPPPPPPGGGGGGGGGGGPPWTCCGGWPCLPWKGTRRSPPAGLPRPRCLCTPASCSTACSACATPTAPWRNCKPISSPAATVQRSSHAASAPPTWQSW